MADKAFEAGQAPQGGHNDGAHPPPPPYSEATNAASYPSLPVNMGIPQQPPYPPAPTSFAPMVTTTTTNVIISRPTFGPFPVEMDCPYCQAHVVTSTQHIPGALPWIIFAICFVLGFFLLIPWCLCCIPFCVDSCLDVQHDCPSCKRTLGRYSRM
uniref:LITAF domain-containing protein n=1 Tax=Plectus sambesii TaxID=2011161 RepID=A0A914V6Q3_9BILA